MKILLKIVRSFFPFVFFVCFLSIHCFAENVVKIATLVDYAPYCFLKPDAPGTGVRSERIPPNSDSKYLQGYSWDIIRASFKSMDYTINLKIVPWARAVKTMEDNKVEVLFPTSRNKKRSQKYYYSREAISKSNVVIYYKAGSSFEWKGINSLNGKKIAAIRGYNYGEIWKAQTKIMKHDINKRKQALVMIEKGRVDGFVAYEISNDYYIKQNGLKGKFKKTPTIDFNEDFLVGMKNNPKVIKILDDFDAGKRKITVDGTLNSIRKKWGLN